MWIRTPSEIQTLDLSAKVKVAGESVANMSREEKLKWTMDQKRIGNELYALGKFSEAMEIYVQVGGAKSTYLSSFICLLLSFVEARFSRTGLWEYRRLKTASAAGIAAPNYMQFGCMSNSAKGRSKSFFLSSTYL